MFNRSPLLKLEFTEQAAAYLESRLAMRKFDLGVSSAPLAASFFLLEHIREVDFFWLDILFSIGMFCLLTTSFISAVQIHRFSRCLGEVRSVLAQSANSKGNLGFRSGIEGLNRFEIVLNGVGYSIIIFLLAGEVWEFSK